MALDLFKQFATNTKAEEEGKWVDFGEGVEFLIARANNKKYSRMITKAYEKNKRILDTKGDAAEKKSEEILVDVMAQTILLDWRGEFEWNEKKVTDYSKDQAKEMLRVKDFRRWVAQQADEFENFKLEQEEDDKGK